MQAVTLTQQVNTGTELTLGSACANMLEATLITPEGALTITPGTELTLYKVDDAGIRWKVGLFTVEKATRLSINGYKITAYDRISWLDRDLTDWLESLNGWPYTLHSFAQMVCAACNLTLLNESLANGDWLIQKFSAWGITGRQLMQWVGQICGRYVKATEDGYIQFAWYTPKTVIWETLPILSCRIEDYRTAPVDKVQICLTEKDVGVICGTGSNTYALTGNFLLTTETPDTLQPIAETLYNLLRGVSYTPCRLKIPANTQISTGDILSVPCVDGTMVTVYVMKKVQIGPLETLECTGSPCRTASSVTNNTKFTNLYGSVLELQADVNGLRAENRNADGRTAALEMTVDGMQTSVQQQAAGLAAVVTRITSAEQTAESLSMEVKTVKTDGISKVSTTTGYTFDENGITVEKSGREIKTQITEDGMQVFKNRKTVLTANSEGVDAVDLTASTYLVVGGRSRFENYDKDRTGCFWIGG